MCARQIETPTDRGPESTGSWRGRDREVSAPARYAISFIQLPPLIGICSTFVLWASLLMRTRSRFRGAYSDLAAVLNYGAPTITVSCESRDRAPPDGGIGAEHCYRLDLTRSARGVLLCSGPYVRDGASCVARSLASGRALSSPPWAKARTTRLACTSVELLTSPVVILASASAVGFLGCRRGRRDSFYVRGRFKSRVAGRRCAGSPAASSPGRLSDQLSFRARPPSLRPLGLPTAGPPGSYVQLDVLKAMRSALAMMWRGRMACRRIYRKKARGEEPQ